MFRRAMAVRKPQTRRHAPIALRDADLNRCRALDRGHDAPELHQHAIAGQLDDAPAPARDLALDQLLAMGLERGQGPGFVPPYKTAVAGHVSGENSSEPALHA